MNVEPADLDLVQVLGLAEAYKANPHGTLDYAVRQTWATPAALVRGLERLAGCTVELDLCAEQHTAKAPVWFGPRSPHGVTDTLNETWESRAGLAWCNPDFRRKGQWADLVLASKIPTWFLVPPATDQPWFGRLLEHPRAHLHALQGRVAFEPPEGVAATSPNGPVVLWSLNFARPLFPARLIVRDLLSLGA